MKREKRSNYDPGKTWYHDRYIISLVQRNLLFVFCLACFGGLIASLVVIKVMVEKNAVEPYIVEVSDASLIPTTVSTESVDKYAMANPLVIEYFLTKYVTARETYDNASFAYDYGTVVRAMSGEGVYASFKKITNNKETSPIAVLGKNGRIDVSIKQVVPKTKEAVFIFRINKKVHSYDRVISDKNYQVTMKYTFNTINMSYQDAMINPLGIKVNFYELLDERDLTN